MDVSGIRVVLYVGGEGMKVYRDENSWMSMTKGGPRESVYSAPRKKKKRRGWMQEFREEAAEFKRRRIDRYAR